jgi:two-component system sensor histidine kinase/response regulator
MVQLELRRSLGDKLRVEQALRASEQKWLHVLEQTHDLIAWITPAGRFVSVNRAWLKALGYTERDITNMAFQDVVEVHSLPQWREAFDRALSGQLAGPLELSLQAKSGRPVFVQGNLHCDYEAGQPASLLGIFRNVSELKRLEAEAGRSPAASSVATANQICTFDPQVLMIGLHGRMDVLQELAAVFERDSPAMLERIRQAIQAQDADALEEAAHKLKGAISMFRADAAMNLAVTLEKLGARNNFTGASEILSRLGDETGALIRDLKILLAAPPAKDKSG